MVAMDLDDGRRMTLQQLTFTGNPPYSFRRIPPDTQQRIGRDVAGERH
jgi:hypothetical protein